MGRCRILRKLPLDVACGSFVGFPLVPLTFSDFGFDIPYLDSLDVCGCGRHNPKCKEDSSQCWNPGQSRQPDNCGQPNPSPVRAPNPAPVSAPVSMPVTEVSPTVLGDRKSRPNVGNKSGSRMAGGARGGSAGSLRFSNRQLKGDESS